MEAAKILLIQAFWLLILYVAVDAQWRRGLRSYAAEGG
jgi:ABC-type uncharacterized transport system permease subunit